MNKAYSNEEVKQYYNKEKIDEYREVGGVRLEDVFILIKDGLEKISTLPRTVEDVEAFLAL